MTGVFALGTVMLVDDGSPLTGTTATADITDTLVSALAVHCSRIVVAGGGHPVSSSACERLDADLTTVAGQARLADAVRQTPDLALVVNLLDAPAPGHGLDRGLSLLRRWCDASVVLHAALAAITTAGHRPRLLNVVCDSGADPVTDPLLVGAREFVRGWAHQCQRAGETRSDTPVVAWLEVCPATVRQAVLAAAAAA